MIEDLNKLVYFVSGIRFSDLTGTDYSEGAIDLARNLADRDGFSSIRFLVCQNIETDRKQQLSIILRGIN